MTADMAYLSFFSQNGGKLEILLFLLKLKRMCPNLRNVYFVNTHPIGEHSLKFGVNWFFGWKLNFLMTADMANLSFLSKSWWIFEMLVPLLKLNRMHPNLWNVYFVSSHPRGKHLLNFKVKWFFWIKTEFFDDRGYGKPLIFEPKWVKTWNASFSAKSE